MTVEMVWRGSSGAGSFSGRYQRDGGGGGGGGCARRWAGCSVVGHGEGCRVVGSCRGGERGSLKETGI